MQKLIPEVRGTSTSQIIDFFVPRNKPGMKNLTVRGPLKAGDM